MARPHARILTTIWSDPDFTALSALAQRLYLLALSQPTLSFCGVLSYTARRWASFAPDTEATDIEKAVEELEWLRFVLLDRDTEEMMIRSFVKNDGVLKSPNITIAMSKDFTAITSKDLRSSFVEGFPEGFLEGLPEATRKGLGEPFVQALRNPSPKGSPNPTGTPPGGVPVRALRPHGAEPYPCPQPYPSPPGAGGTVSVLRDGSAGPNGGEGKSQVNGTAPPWADDRHAERWQTFADRIAAVLGRRHFPAAVALVDRWRTILDHRFIDQAIGLCEGAAEKPRSIGYFETALATTAGQQGVDVPAIPAGSVAR